LKKLSEATKYRKLDNFFITPDRAQSFQKTNLITTEANLIQERVIQIPKSETPYTQNLLLQRFALIKQATASFL
jgi:hypothetical protein